MSRFFRILFFFILSLSVYSQYPEIHQFNIFEDENFRKHQEELEKITPLVVRWERNKGNPQLQEALLSSLVFYRYRVKEGDNLYSLGADLMLNVDTLASLNSIDHPLFIYPGSYLLVPNLPGIFQLNHENGPLAQRIRMTARPDNHSLNLRLQREENIIEVLFFPGEIFSPDERLYFTSRPFSSPLIHFQVGSGFGFRPDPFHGRMTLHSGLDLNVPTGTEIFSIASGTVKETGWLENYGFYIIIIHEGGYESLYGHLNRILVEKGSVEEGDLIGLSGNTGRSTGPHLHLEIRKNDQAIDPATLIRIP